MIMMKTKQITTVDVQQVANDLKMVINDDIAEQVLELYDGYCLGYPDDNWTSIVEIILYDITGPILRYMP